MSTPGSQGQAPNPHDPYRPAGPYGVTAPTGWSTPPEPPPGSPPQGSLPPSAPAAPRRSGATAERALAAAGLVLLLVGLAVPADARPAVLRLPLWSLFALACAVVVVVVVATASLRAQRVRRYLLVAAAAGLAAFWVLLVLPGVGSNIGFLQTAGTASALVAAGLHLHAR